MGCQSRCWVLPIRWTRRYLSSCSSRILRWNTRQRFGDFEAESTSRLQRNAAHQPSLSARQVHRLHTPTMLDDWMGKRQLGVWKVSEHFEGSWRAHHWAEHVSESVETNAPGIQLRAESRIYLRWRRRRQRRLQRWWRRSVGLRTQWSLAGRWNCFVVRKTILIAQSFFNIFSFLFLGALVVEKWTFPAYMFESPTTLTGSLKLLSDIK